MPMLPDDGESGSFGWTTQCRTSVPIDKGTTAHLKVYLSDQYELDRKFKCCS